jgi:uncharacterized cofD-like protein
MRRSRLQWLYPGVGVKRWVVLIVAGAAVAVYALLVLLGAAANDQMRGELGLHWTGSHPLRSAAVASLFLAGGTLALGYGLLRLFRFSGPSGGAGEIRTGARLARGPRIVAIGGGTGLSALLSGLKQHTSNLTAVVTVADDGGSSGKLRRELGMLPPGDIRNCLVGLADDESLMSRLFQHRFSEGELEGHNFGNLFVAALTEVTGDFERAVRESTRVLKVRGQVLPATLDDLVLHAELQDGERVAGESTITAADRLPRRVWLEPDKPRALPQAIEAIADADLVVLGPGSVYTSIVPNLLVPGVCDAVRHTRARVVYVCNVMTQPGETDGFSAVDHLAAVYRHGAAGLVDDVVVNDTPVSAELAAAYGAHGAQRVAVDDAALRELGVRVVHADVAAGSDVFRHDPQRLAAILVRLARR